MTVMESSEKQSDTEISLDGSNTNILLETGTNEVELLEFYIGNQSYGVNVLKVKRIVNFTGFQITEQPCTDPSILGVINLQDTIIPVIDLANYFMEEHGSEKESRKIVVTEFNNTVQGFVVDGVNKIHRISWHIFQAVNERFHLDYITGVCIIENKNVMVADFEKIIGTLAHTDIISGMNLPDSWSDDGGEGRDEMRILCAEDSNMVRELLSETLEEAGFSKVMVFSNGQVAMDAIEAFEIKSKEESKPITDYFNIVISDIEMPVMDGFSFCKKVKSKYPECPVIMLSSLISEEIIERCKRVNADKTVSKGEYESLIKEIDAYAKEINSSDS